MGTETKGEYGEINNQDSEYLTFLINFNIKKTTIIYNQYVLLIFDDSFWIENIWNVMTLFGLILEMGYVLNLV